MRTPIHRCQLMTNHILDSFIWMLCILEWDNAAFKSPMNVKPSIMRDTSMICWCLSLESFPHSPLLVLFKKDSYRTMISDGQWLNSQSTAEQMMSRIQAAIIIFLNQDIVQWITTFLTISTFKINTMILYLSNSTKNTKIFFKDFCP